MKTAINAFAFALLLSSLASAANIGVSPAKIDFLDVLRGGYSEKLVRITVDSEEPLKVKVSKWGEISEWMNVSKTELRVSRSNPGELVVSVTPPTDTPNGVYTGFLRIEREGKTKNVKPGATGIVIPTLDLYISVSVTDKEIKGCRASGFKVTNAEEGEDIYFTAEIENTGNVRFAPLIVLDVWNQDSTEILKNIKSSENEITPTKREKVTVKFSSEGLPIGQYWLEASIVDCFNAQTLTFDVLEEGALLAKGVLEKIKAPVWATVGDTIPILATFRNTGEKPLQTKFKGKVTYEGKIIQRMESDKEVFVPIGEKGEYLFYFTPKEPGKYLFSGRVFYDSKRTYEKAAAFNAVGKNRFWTNAIKVLTYLILLALIAFLLVRIKKERQEIKRGVRRIKKI